MTNQDGQARPRIRGRHAAHGLLAAAAATATMAGLLTSAGSAAAATPFTPGDVVVYTAAGGGSAASAITLREFDSSGNNVTNLAMPTTDSAPNHALTGSGKAGSEGMMTLSPDGSELAVPGYDAPLGTASITGTSSVTYPRVVGIVDQAGDINTTTALTNIGNANNMRGAVVDGNNIWTTDAADGVSYTTVGSTTASAVGLTSSTNNSMPAIFDGQLYVSAKASFVGTVGTGLPESTGQVSPSLSFASNPPGQPYAYAFLSLNASSDGAPDTLYVADQTADTTGAIVKYGLDTSGDANNGKWIYEGAVAVPYIEGLAANDSGGDVTIYATSTGTTSGNAGTLGTLYKYNDTSGLNGKASSLGALTGSATSIATAGASVAFRGVAFAPGTTIGSGGGTVPAATSGVAISPSSTSLSGSIGDPTNPTVTVTVSDSNNGATIETPTAVATNTAVAQSATLTPTGTPGQYTLSVVPGTTAGETTITIDESDSNANLGTTTVTYGLSPSYGGSGDRYYSGAGNGSSEIDLGDGYFVVGDDETNVLHLYNKADSSLPLASYDFTGNLPDGASSVDIEAAAMATDPATGVRTIYWLGSLSDSSSGNQRPAADTLFATTVSGSGANTQLTYVGSYMFLRDDLIAWDEANNNALGLNAASQATAKSTTGFNVEGMEFAPGSTSTVDIAFRAPLEPYGTGNEALIVPVTNLPSLIGQSTGGQATFGRPIELNLGGLGIREIRKNADNQYLIVAGTSTGDNDDFSLYTWDGQPTDQPTLTDTTWDGDSTPSAQLPSDPLLIDGSDTLSTLAPDTSAWEGIESVPDPLANGSQTELIQDDGDVDWYGTGATSKSGLPTGLQKDLGRTFTIELPTPSISFGSVPSTASLGDSYDAADQVTSQGNLAVTTSIGASSTAGACMLSGGAVTFTGAGTCVIDAAVAGNISWAPNTAMASVMVNAPTKTNPTPGTTTPASTTPTTTTTTTPVVTNPAPTVTESSSSKVDGKDKSDAGSSAGALFKGNVAQVLVKAIKSGKLTLGFSEGSAGTFTEVIYETVGTGKKAKKVEVGKGTVTVKKAGKGSVALKLTARGRKLLEQAVSGKAKVTLATDLSFNPKKSGLKTVHAMKSKRVKL